jgi:Tol biopolymer transport system component
LLVLAAACDHRDAPLAPTPLSAFAIQSAGGKIAFSSNRDGTYGIYVMNDDGTAVTRVTSNSDYHPAWSPDGTRLVFTSTRDGNYELYVMNADGTGVTRLTNNPAWDLSPAWSPDGSRIAFASERDGNDEIYVMNADGSAVTRLTSNPTWDGEPAWSPDGSRLAFGSNRGGTFAIYVMNADGTGVAQLSTTGWSVDPVWSPDGSRIAFKGYADGSHEIYVMNADGTGVTRLTNIAGTDENPVWSPDGSQIAFDSNRDGDFEIYVMNADGTGLTRLTNDPSNDVLPAWFGAVVVGPSAVAWPNDPPGFMTLTDWPYNQLVTNADGSLALGPNPWNQAPGTGDTAIVSDPGAPLSPSSVARLTYPIGMLSGTDPWGLYFDPARSGREFYTAFWWKASAGWEGEPSGINIISLWKDDTQDGPVGTLVVMMNNQNQPAYFLTVALEFNVANNGHLVNAAGSETMWYVFGNVNGGNYEVVPGNWYRIELYFKGSATPTSQDGVLRWWATKLGDAAPTQVGNYTTVNFDTGNFAEFVFAPTWGGNTGARKTQTDFYWFDHAHVSAP